MATDGGIFVNSILTDSNFSTTASLVRAFRIMRIFRLIRASKNLKVLIDTIAYIIPSLANLGALILLLLFIYALLGMNLFSQVMYQDELGPNANFRFFGTSLMLLLRCATGEKWNILMNEFANSDGYRGVPCIDN